MRVKEKSERAGLKLNIPKAKIMAHGSITSWQTEGEKVEAVTGFIFFSSVQFSSVAQSCLTLCDPMSRSMPGHHQLPEFTQTHVYRVSDVCIYNINRTCYYLPLCQVRSNMNHEKKIDNVLCKFRGKIIRRLIDLILLHVSH